MFDKNWNILIGVLVIVLVFAYFRNCSEGFAVSNDEAIANVAALYNKDNMSVTNLTTTGAFNSRFKNDTWIPHTDGINYIRGPTRLEGATTFTQPATFEQSATFKQPIKLDKHITTPMLDLPGAQLSQSDKSPNALNIQYGDGTGWRANFKKWDGTTFASIYDNGTLCLGNTCINEDHLKMLRGEKNIGLKNVCTNHWVGKQSGGYIASLSTGSPNDGNNEGVAGCGYFTMQPF